MMKSYWRAAALLLAVAAGACTNPVSSERHVRPTGVSVLAGDAELFRVSGTDTAAFSIAAGEQTPELTVRFLDSHGDFVNPGEDYFLDVVSGTPAVATWQETEQGAFAGRIAGVSPGASTFRFRLMHGLFGGGHEDARFHVRVTVTPASD